MMRCFLLCLFLCLVHTTLAEDQLLLEATNDRDTHVDRLFLRVDEGGCPTHLLHRQSGKAEKIYATKRLEKGVVLRHESGNDVLTLKTLRFDPEKGAAVILRYLYSGIPPAEYRSVKLVMKRKGGIWSLFQEQTAKPLRAIHFQTNIASVFGIQKSIGIRAIRLLR